MAQDKTKLTFNPLTGSFDLVQDVSDLVEQSELANYIETSEKGAPNGVAELDAGGKVPATQLPNSIMEYKGNWDASTNSPTLADGTGDPGDVYRVSVAGTQDLGSGPITFNVGDFVIYSGTIWEKSINSNEVVSVNGYTGVVDLDTDDIDEGSTNLYFTDARAQTAVAGDLANKQDTIIANDRQVIFKDPINGITGFEGLYQDPVTGGIAFFKAAQPDNYVQYRSINTFNLNVEPLQNSPDDVLSNINTYINLDPNSSGFDIGSNGEVLDLFSQFVNHGGTSNIGVVNFIKNNFTLGNGTDPITVRGFGYSYGFGTIRSGVTVENGGMQGYGYQPNIEPGAILNSTYTQAFYDNAQIQVASPSYTSFNSSPNIEAIQNNTGFSGLNINANINEFLGNAGYVGIGLYGNLGNFGTGGYTGININPNISGVQYANGISVSMDNVTVYPGSPASLIIQDLTVAADLPSSQGNTVTIEYTPGATAGSEVVSNVGLAFEVQIEDGVSTAQQIHDALNAYLAFTQNLNVTISGTASNPQTIQAPTNLTGGTDPGNKKAAYFDGDVDITGNLTFSGSLSIGKLNAFASQAIINGGGTPQSVHMLISQPTIAANTTVAMGDTFGINTAMLLNTGANSHVTTSFIGLSALALPAVVNMDTGSTIDKVAGATFALSLDAAAGGGTISELSLCRALAIPNGVTSVTSLYGYKFELPFGDPGTTTWGLHISAGNNYLSNNLKIGGTDLVTNSSVGLELESTTKAAVLSRMTTTERNALTALTGMMLYNTTDQMMQWYDGTVWKNATGAPAGANLSLSNLTFTSINQSLVADTDYARNLGSQTVRWLRVFSNDVWANRVVTLSGNASVSVTDRNLIDSSDDIAIDWNVRDLCDNSSQPVVSWSNAGLNLHSKNISSLADPINAQDASTKNYVDTRALNDLSDVVITSPTANELLQYNGTNWVNQTVSFTPTWGSITGTLSSQTDLQNALNLKANTSLNNLGSTAINTQLLPDTNNLRNIGTPSLRWATIYTTNVNATSGNISGLSLTYSAYINWTGGFLTSSATSPSGFSLGASNQGAVLRTTHNTTSQNGALIYTDSVTTTNSIDTGFIGIETGNKSNVSGSGHTGIIKIKTGNNIIPTGNSGNIELITGTPGSSGTRGKITLDANIIDIISPTKFVNMDTTTRNALTAQSGMVIFNTTTSKLQCYDGSSWQDMF